MNHNKEQELSAVLVAIAKCLGINIKIESALISPHISKICESDEAFNQWVIEKTKAHLAGEDHGELTEELANANAATKAGTHLPGENKLWSRHIYDAARPTVYIVTENIGGEFTPTCVMSEAEMEAANASFVKEMQAKIQTNAPVIKANEKELPPHNQPIGNN